MDDTHEASRFRAAMLERVGQDRYEVWFGGATRLSVNSDTITVHTASGFLLDWLSREFRHDLKEASVAVFGQALPIKFVVGQSEPPDQSGTASTHTTTHATLGPTKRAERAERTLSTVGVSLSAGRGDDRGPHSCDGMPSSPRGGPAAPKPPDNELTFATFSVGQSNEFAYRAAQLVADGLHQASPLLVCGPTGVGKTHLLRAIRNAYRRNHPRSRVLYLTGEQFTSGFISALRGSGMPSFRQKCRGAELLLVDDIHFLAGKRATLEELQHTIDAMAGEGHRLVLASDRSLGALQQLGAELVSRFSGGLTCEIRPPEFATRADLVRRLARQLKLECDDDILAMVATRVTQGARELRGALNRLQLSAAARQEPVTREMADAVLIELAQQVARPVKLADIQKAVCDVFGIESATLHGQRKGRAASQPRMLAMWLARKHTRAPWSEIGHFFGRRSHSTVISAHRRVESLLRSEATLAVSDHSCRVEEVLRRVEAALRTA